jgi:glycosyltransferase involved in cell wall biosynthesis
MSEDGTQEYVMSIGDSRVRYFRNPNHGIIAVNRNVGIRNAKGDYVAFCDDDDLWFPEKLQKQTALLDSDRQLALCYSNATSFSAAGILEHQMIHKKVFSGHYKNLLIGNFIVNSTVLLRRELFAKFGLLSEARANIAVEDYAMWLAISRKYKLAYVDESLISYRVHGAANSSNLGEMARKSLKVIAGEYSKNGPFLFYVYALTRAFVRFAYKNSVKR